MTLRPSSLPMFAACPCFESGETPWTEPGTNRHKLFGELIFNRLVSDATKLPDEAVKLKTPHDQDDLEACEWAVDYFFLKADLSTYKPVSEKKMSVVLPDFTEMEGTPDLVCGQDLFDLKTRERNYSPQMAAYALMIFEANPNFEFVRVHLMFTALRRVVEYTLTQEDALMEVSEVIGNTRPQDGKEPQPKACEYCGWCSKRLTCPAMTGPVVDVATGYADKTPEINITNWHLSQMETAEQIALGLTIWRSILKKWGESMEFHALEAVMKKGLQLPGFTLKQSQGKNSCTDAIRAFALLGLPQAEFMKCCDLRMNTSKTYPDRLGLVETYAEFLALKKAAAKKEVEARLEPVMKRGNPSPKLVAEKGDDEETE